MRIKLSGVFVQDQEVALQFYTKMLGFEKKTDIPVGEFRWLTVISPTGHDDVELVLEPNQNPVAATYQKGLLEQGIPATAFEVDDVAAEYERLEKLGVEFTMQPTEMDSTTLAVFKDTCGNLIQIYQN